MAQAKKTTEEAEAVKVKTDQVVLKGRVKHRGRWRKANDKIYVTAAAKKLLTEKELI